MPPTIILHHLLEMQYGKETVITIGRLQPKKFTYKMLYIEVEHLSLP